MSLSHRMMRAKDVPACIEIVATHPVFGPRYGRAIKQLHQAWLKVLGAGAMRAVVFEEVEAGHVTDWGLGVSVIVSDDYVRELKTAPLSWFGPGLATRIVRGDSPLVSDKEIRHGNANSGLNLLVWEAFPRIGFETRAELFHKMVSAFVEVHRGFLWKEMITSQAESPERVQWTLGAGGMLWNPRRQRYEEFTGKDAERIPQSPHIIGLTRESEFARPGSWISSLFDFRPPCLNFSRSQQRLLHFALAGGTDQELSKTLGISLPAVKRHGFRSIVV